MPVKQSLRPWLGALRSLAALHVSQYAASTGFFILLSSFPALVLLLGLLQYTGLRVENLVAVLEELIPEALTPGLEEIISDAYAAGSGAMVGLSALTALWSASRGIYGLLKGLNAIYGVRETRGYLRTRLISVAYTFAFLLILVLTLILHLFGSTLLALLRSRPGSFAAFLADTLNLQNFLLPMIQTLIFTVMFMVLPGRRSTFRESLPGAALAAVGWLIFSDLYSIYVEQFAPLSSVYGSVYAVALSMLWLYCCLSIVFYGGALNHFLQQKQLLRKDDQPLVKN